MSLIGEADLPFGGSSQLLPWDVYFWGWGRRQALNLRSSDNNQESGKLEVHLRQVAEGAFSTSLTLTSS
jgi:hypothetical protein